MSKLKSDLEILKSSENLTPDEPVNLDLDSFDSSEEEPEVKAEKPEVRSDDGDGPEFFQGQCGRLGGSAVLQAFGRAAHNLLPGKHQQCLRLGTAIVSSLVLALLMSEQFKCISEMFEITTLLKTKALGILCYRYIQTH